MTAEAVNFGLPVGLVAHGAVHIAEVRFVGIALREIGVGCLFRQFFKAAVVVQAASVFNRIILLGQLLAVASGAGDVRPGMEGIEISGAGPGIDHLLQKSQVILGGSPPGALLSQKAEALFRHPCMAG